MQKPPDVNCKKCKGIGMILKKSPHDGKKHMVLCSCRYVNPNMRPKGNSNVKM